MKAGFTTGSWSLVHGAGMSLLTLSSGRRRVRAAALADDDLRRHVLNRLTFAATGEAVDAAAVLSPGDLVEALLDASPRDLGMPVMHGDDDWSTVPQWWFDVMRHPGAGLHERMVWFWHGHLTSSMDTSSPALMFRQQVIFRRHAAGSFRDLLQEVTVDPAMLFWLNGAWSTADNPNENYARELMELFALGRNNGYTEDDVHQAAVALAGWWVDGDHDDRVEFDPERGPRRTVPLFGGRVGSAAEVIDAVCDHPACAPHIAGALYRALHGVDPADDVRAELAAVFADGGLQLRPLLEATVRHPTFLGNPQPRPRSHLEWYIALCRFLRRDDVDVWPLYSLGQMPFSPPNVAGWPGNDRWLSVGAELTKAQLAFDLMWDAAPPDSDDVVGELCWRAGISPGPATRAALDEAYVTGPDEWEPYRSVMALIPLTPEFNII